MAFIYLFVTFYFFMTSCFIHHFLLFLGVCLTYLSFTNCECHLLYSLTCMIQKTLFGSQLGQIFVPCLRGTWLLICKHTHDLALCAPSCSAKKVKVIFLKSINVTDLLIGYTHSTVVSVVAVQCRKSCSYRSTECTIYINVKLQIKGKMFPSLEFRQSDVKNESIQCAAVQ